jgi:glycerol-1-phosphate dehydrogenase [NAD(P)+]
MLNDKSAFETPFGRTIACECGRTHKIDPEEIIYEENALARIPDMLSRFASGRRAVVLMDCRTRGAAGLEAADRLRGAGWRVAEICVPDPGEGLTPRCDDITRDRLAAQIPQTDILLPVGSGVLSDLGKWLASDLARPYVCFATAATMNGYTSANIAATVNGVKTLIRGRPPRAVLADPAVLRDAPFALTAAGFGDVLAKPVSSADWRVNQLLFGDYYCDRAVSLISGIEPLYLDHPDRLPAGYAEALEALYRSLLLTGAAMTMAETSAPASGGEHLISHALDMMAGLDGHPHDLHGRQVGLGTLLASEIYRRLLSLESPDFSRRGPGVDRSFWGTLGGHVEKEYGGKIEKLDRAARALPEGSAWDRLREAAAPLLRPPGDIRESLKRAGAAYRAEDIGCTGDRLRTALEHAHEIRARFTVLDLARLAGILPGQAGEIVAACA